MRPLTGLNKPPLYDAEPTASMHFLIRRSDKLLLQRKAADCKTTIAELVRGLLEPELRKLRDADSD